FVNGVPYKFGQPLIDYSNNSRGEGTEYELTVKSRHYKFPDREAVSKKKIVVNSTPPEKTRLKGIIGKRINLHALGTLFKFEIENNTSSRYENKMIIDGERYPIGTTLSSINIDLNGQYELVIITKDKENGLYSYNGYYIDNNRNYAASDNYYSRDTSEYNRNILIARTRDEQLPRFTNELLQDFRTGDISVYD